MAPRILGLVSRGGMADVYAALHGGEIVALKRVRATDETARALFTQELSLLRLLRHPNIISGIATEDGEGGAPSLVTELLVGASWAELLEWMRRSVTKRESRLVVGIHVLCEVLAALHYLHELRAEGGQRLAVIHRDCTPNNMFVTTAGRVKLLDLGNAVTSERATFTKTGELRGTLRYMSPEQALSLPLDRRADVFSIGACLRELVTGDPPWHELADDAFFRALTAGNYPIEVDGAPPAYNEVLARALARDGSRRFPTAEQLRFELVRLRDAFTGGGSPPVRQLAGLVDDAFGARSRRLLSAIAERRASGQADLSPLLV